MGTIAKYQCAKDYNICDSFIDFLKCGSRGIYIYIYILHKTSSKWVKLLSIFFMSRYTKYLLHSKKCSPILMDFKI